MAKPFTPEQISQILEEFFKVVGTRQYIGARYVPIFGRKGEESIEWDNSAPYEPLTIVLYQGNSYTSRQYVPVGVEITNQEFWAITGNYNAQVELYRQEVRNLLPYDETPTEDSTKAVTSDGIKKAIDTAVSVETTRATEAEQANATAIADETTRATQAEQTLQTSIDSETTRAKAAEQTLQANIDTEKTRAETAEQTLQANIKTLEKEKHVVTLEMFGGKADDSSFDNSDALKNAISTGLPVYFLGNCDYYFKTEINLPSTVYIEMHGFNTTLHNFNIVFNAVNNHWVHAYPTNFSLIEGFNFMDVDPTKPVIYTGSAIKIHKCTTRKCGTLLALTMDYHDFVCLENVITYNPDVSHFMVSGFSGATFTGTDAISGDQIYFKQVHMAEIVPNDAYKTQLLCWSTSSYRIFNCLNCGCGAYDCDIYIHDSYFEHFDLKYESTGAYSSNVTIDCCTFTHFVDFSNVKNVIFTNCVFKDGCNPSFTINGIDYAVNKFSNCTFQCSNDLNSNKRASVCHEGNEIANTIDPYATISDFALTAYPNGTLPSGTYTVQVFPSVFYDKIEGKITAISEHTITLENNSAIYGVVTGNKHNVKTCFLHIFITYPDGKTVHGVLPNSNDTSFIFTGRTINCLKVKDSTVTPTVSSKSFARYGAIGVSNSNFTSSSLPIKANVTSGKVIAGDNWN